MVATYILFFLLFVSCFCYSGLVLFCHFIIESQISFFGMFCLHLTMPILCDDHNCLALLLINSHVACRLAILDWLPSWRNLSLTGVLFNSFISQTWMLNLNFVNNQYVEFPCQFLTKLFSSRILVACIIEEGGYEQFFLFGKLLPFLQQLNVIVVTFFC